MKTDNFFGLYKSKVSDNPLKHELLKEILIAAIENGHWSDGDKLPTEQEFAKITPLSLGTIQKAIGSLTREGYVQRKRGSGTFVIPREKRLGEPWIYQILASDGSRFVPMTSEVRRRVEVESNASWAQWLSRGESNQVIVRLERIIAAEDYLFLSHYHVNICQFPFFRDVPLEKLRSENFVKLTQKIYKLSPSRIVRTVKTDLLPRFATEALTLPHKTYGTHLEIMASSSAGVPIFFNQMYLPAGGPRIYF
jgi:GntR family transcriptional regulator